MFLPENIDLAHSEKYVLSIRLKRNEFMFSIHEPGNGRAYCLRETTFQSADNLHDNLQRIIFELGFLTQEFRQTNVIIVSSDYELIPASYYNVKEKKQIYELAHMQEEKHILSGLLEKQDIITLFGIEEEIYGFLSRNLWDPHFIHHSVLLGNYFEGRVKTDKGQMFLNFHDGLMDVLCFKQQRLIHSLTYNDEPAANQVYYVLKLWESCGFDQLEDNLCITGKPDDSVLIRLQEYISHIEKENMPSEIYLWNEGAQKAPLDLLTLAL